MPIADCGFADNDEVPGQRWLVLFGPTLPVDIGFDPDFDYAGSTTRPPRSAATMIAALVDTGAMESCVDSQLAHELGLPVVDRQAIAGVGGLHEVSVYLAHIVVPSLRLVTYGRFYGVNLAGGGQHHSALIGRSFLQDKILIYDGRTGRATIAC